LFAVGGLVAGTEHENVVELAQDVFGTPDHFGKERVRDIENHYADRVASANSQLVGRSAANEPSQSYGVKDPLSGIRGDDRRSVEYIRRRTDRYLRQIGDVSDRSPPVF